MEDSSRERLTSLLGGRILLIRDAWHRFWYDADDPIGVSLLRIATGAMLLYTLMIWSLDLTAFFVSKGGWQSAELVGELQRGQWAISLWWLVPDGLLWPVHLLCVAIVAAFTVGYQTPYTKFAAFVIGISYANRIPMAQFGLDQVTCMWLLYLCLGPCGARLSLDRWLACRCAALDGTAPPKISPSSSARLSMRMVQIHLCVIYFWAGLSKVQGETWVSGEAIWRIASNYEHQSVSLTWLAYIPWLFQLLSIGTWMWELSFSFLIWNRILRWPMLMIGMSMHIGIGLFLGLWTFALIMIFGYLAFVPTALLRRMADTVTTRFPGVLPISMRDHSRWADRRIRSSGSRWRIGAMEEDDAPAFGEEQCEDEVFPKFTTLELASAQSGAGPTESIIEQKEKPSLSSGGIYNLAWLSKKIAFVGSQVDKMKPADQDRNEPNDEQAPSSERLATDSRVLNMLPDSDRDNLILFVERSAKRRCSLIRALEDKGYRCIGLDAWPETIAVYNVLKPRYVICNGFRMPVSELNFWRSQLEERPDSAFVVLADSQQVAALSNPERHTIAIPTPASFEAICEALEGNTPGTDPPQDASSTDEGEQIISMPNRTNP